jgi:hypothetical protein
MVVDVRFYATEQIGPKRHKTPEGYLICQDVPLARTGIMEYGQEEIPSIPADENGVIRIIRRHKSCAVEWVINQI